MGLGHNFDGMTSDVTSGGLEELMEKEVVTLVKTSRSLASAKPVNPDPL